MLLFRKRVITIRPRAPWYSEEIKKQKVICLGLKDDGVVPDSLPTINLIPTNALL